MLTRIKALFFNIFGGVIIAGVIAYVYIFNLVSAIIEKFKPKKHMIKVEIE